MTRKHVDGTSKIYLVVSWRTFSKAARIGIPFAVAFWILESVFHVYVLGDGNLEQQLLQPELHELWMRLIVLVSITTFAMFATSYFGARSRVATMTEEAIELKRAKDALKVSEDRFREIFQQSPVGIVIADTDLKILDTNPALQATFGYSAEEYRNLTVPQLSHPDDMPHNSDLAQRALAGETEGYELEKRLLAKSGQEVWGHVRASLVNDAEGHPQFFVGTVEDITERKRAIELSSALDALNPTIMASLDPDSILKSAATEASRVFESDSSAIVLLDNEEWYYHWSQGLGAESAKIRFPRTTRTHEYLISATSDVFAQRSTAEDDRLSEDPIALFGVRSLLGIPISEGDRVIGVLGLYYHSLRRTDFSDIEIDFARKLGISVSLALANAKKLAREQHIATNLQDALEPKLDHIPDVELGHIYRSATESARVGGDFYDVFELDADRVAIVIGDVSGKGVEAARFTGLLRHTLRAYAYEHTSPAEVVRSSNQAIIPLVPKSMFATVFYGVLCRKTCSVVYCTAGHPSPLIVEKDHVTVLPATNSPLVGAFGGLSYGEGEIELNRDSTLLLYTDGVTESRNLNSGEFLGEEGLVGAMDDLKGFSSSEIPSAVFGFVDGFTQGRLSDDIAILSVSPNFDTR